MGKRSIHLHVAGRFPASWGTAVTTGRSNKRQHLGRQLQARKSQRSPQPNTMSILGIENIYSTQGARVPQTQTPSPTPFPSLTYTPLECTNLNVYKDTTDDPWWLKRIEEEYTSLTASWVSEKQRRERYQRWGFFLLCWWEGQPCGEAPNARSTASLPNE